MQATATASTGKWVTLLRIPNLFTVPGDIIAGHFLAVPFSENALSYRMLFLIGSSLFLYSGGMILNDWFDLERDRRQRPQRPLAAGQISARTALTVAVLLFGVALSLAAASGRGSLAIAAAILVLIVFYNGAARRVPLLGFVTMGLCRGTNLLLGASIAFPALSPVVLTAAAVEVCYIAAVTAAASKETEGPPRLFARLAPLLVLVAGLIFLVIEAGSSIYGFAACVVVISCVFLIVISMHRDMPTHKMPRKIGALIRALIPLQAAFILAGAPTAFAGAAFVYALWPASRLAGRRIQGS